LAVEATRRLVDETDVFACLGAEARAFIAERLEPMTVAGGDELIVQGDDADALYIIALGRLRVTMTRDDGSEVVLAERGRGEVVGEMALVSNEQRSATVTAVRDSQVLRFPTEAFLQLVQEHPESLRELTTQFVRRLVQPVRHGSPAGRVVTMAVVPLDDDRETLALGARLGAALRRLTGASSHVTFSGMADALGDPERVAADHLAGWFAQHEATCEVVVYDADPGPTAWTDACIRQADLVLLVASASGSPAVRPVEEAIAARQSRISSRTELALVHPSGTRDPRGTRRWLESRSVDRHHHVAADRDADVDRLARLLVGRGIGVVLSGGGARGFASVGALHALHEHGVPIDAVGGTSIGSILALNAARGHDSEEMVRRLQRAFGDRSPFDITFPAVALAAGRRATRLIRDDTEDLDLEDTWRNVFCVSTNLTHATVEVHRRGPAWFAARASFSIPGVLPPVPSPTGDLLADGGLLDNLPVGIMRREHEGITVIAIDVGRTRDLVAGPMSDDGGLSGWDVLMRRFDPSRRDAVPLVNLSAILMRLTELGSARADDFGDLYLRPPVATFSFTDFKVFRRVAAAGYDATRQEITRWLESGDAPSFLRGDLTTTA
jgi:predicted acylesterase/phospholipase RssA